MCLRCDHFVRLRLTYRPALAHALAVGLEQARLAQDSRDTTTIQEASFKSISG
jgi:hypothetical protein